MARTVEELLEHLGIDNVADAHIGVGGGELDGKYWVAVPVVGGGSSSAPGVLVAGLREREEVEKEEYEALKDEGATVL